MGLWYLKFLQIRSFLGHHVSEELILQAVPGDSEIDECRLGLHLWFVMRVGQLGVKDQTEQRVVFNLFVTNLDVSARKTPKQKCFRDCVTSCWMGLKELEGVVLEEIIEQL